MPDDDFNKRCEDLLVRYKRRNSTTLTRRLESLCTFLRQKGDVDVLLIVNESSLVNQPPTNVIEYVRDTIQRRLPNNEVSSGILAVTVKYSKGPEIQVLPAIRRKKSIRIAELGGAKWSNVARPDDFAVELAKVNTARDGRVVPVIKLAKAMTDCFITQEDRKISGYHMESLAIGAFTDYQGPLDPKAMLNRLLRHSAKAAMSPITDSTGQSRYVDEYLGPADSGPRKQASTYLGQMRGKINSCKTRAEFNALFCIED